uniref:Cellulose synthase family protein n=1 Tax=Populus alba TaxID=43335 RepID=A0A4U5PMQ3_POPAL|nr:cellulose synthase family protein [Populus alba]
MASLSSQPSKKAIRSPVSTNNGSSQQGNRGSNSQTVKFARRTSSGRFVSLSRDDIDISGELSGGDYMNYSVQIPLTPDNQPMDTSGPVKAEEQYVSNSLFTGGFNSVTRAYLMDNVIESEASHPQMAGSKGSSCAMPACDGKIMQDERGNDVIPCECRLKICRDCYMDAQKETGLCPGCKEQYKAGDYDDEIPNFSSGALPLPPLSKGGDHNNMTMMKRNQNGDFDHNRWLFETQGTYGYGNAFWPQDDMYGDDGDEGFPVGVLENMDKPWKPLSREQPISQAVISPYRYEDKTEWGDRVGWIYGSVTEDVVTGYRMHNRGWRSVYCITKRDAFRGSAPINLTDRLHQVLRWATGSVEIFFSRNNAFLASRRLKLLQRFAYLNVGIYPFTSIFLIVYCFLPALSLFSGYFIVQTLDVAFLIYLLLITICLVVLAILEVKWSGIELEEWWRNEQFWLISGTSAHFAAVMQGLLKVIAGIEISFTLTSKSAGDEVDDIYADLYLVKWTSLMIMPIVIAMTNIIAMAFAFVRTIYSTVPQWSKFVGGAFFSFWVLAHLYPFAKGLMGRRGKTPTIVFVWSGLIAIIISLLWIAISPQKPNATADGVGGGFQFP